MKIALFIISLSLSYHCHLYAQTSFSSGQLHELSLTGVIPPNGGTCSIKIPMIQCQNFQIEVLADVPCLIKLYDPDGAIQASDTVFDRMALGGSADGGRYESRMGISILDKPNKKLKSGTWKLLLTSLPDVNSSGYARISVPIIRPRFEAVLFLPTKPCHVHEPIVVRAGFIDTSNNNQFISSSAEGTMRSVGKFLHQNGPQEILTFVPDLKGGGSIATVTPSAAGKLAFKVIVKGKNSDGYNFSVDCYGFVIVE